jgi:uncharacterized protein YjbI with pentapeptide repeats
MKRPTLKQLRKIAKDHASVVNGTKLARFYKRDLKGRNFEGWDLQCAVFYFCDLAGANFSKADLTNTLFIGCDMREVNFSDAKLDDTLWEDCYTIE